MVPQSEGGALAPRGGGGGSGNLYDVLELVLDRGLVIDAFVRVSLVGIEILKIDARVVVASVDTYLRFAEACNRLDLESGRKAPSQLTDIVGDATESGARGKSKGALTGAVEAVTDSLQKRRGDDDEEVEHAPRREKQRASSGRSASSRRASRDREE
ncbi:gas vesicle structural protein GvpA [Streptomyces sp. NPDC014892]|uniref:gas vesicle structural protein GvpA n=1 Tax=unclassified Streptomyces TaxID=2593676 RepID=UPI001EFBB8B2|nr:gas vesicle structural protein GvpA [Streptomyces deccanensis]ULR56135.1 gas vesicle structural protein GvpA [Streptomyces deccanensis]